jgi:DNA polymerase-1
MAGGLELLRTAGELRAFLATVSDAPVLAVDTETTGLDPNTDRVLLIQVGTASAQALVDAQAAGPDAVRALVEAAEVPGRTLVLHHAKFDLKMLAALAPEVDLSRVPIMDTMLSEQVLLNGRKAHLLGAGFSLAALAERYAGMGLDKSVREGFMAATNADALGEVELRYAARDVEATWKVFAAQIPALAEENLTRTAAIEGAACLAFAEMERAGMPVDAVAWGKIVDEADREKAEARKVLDRVFAEVISFDLFGHGNLNYDSDQEVLDALGRLGLKLDSTRREVLEAAGHPAALALVGYREHQKIVSTYGRRFLDHVHPRTGRIHSSFKPIGAITGRTSSSEPNLQNIPSSSRFRACFRAPEGHQLITADYSGAELRILAEMSGDPVFVRTFVDGGDLHAIVASRIFGKPVSKTENPELRARAKAINFGLAYGMGAPGLANQIGAPLSEAEQLLDAYFQAFPAIRGYLDTTARDALRRGWCATIAGRKHWFNDMVSSGADEGARVRVAKNMPIQGTNADMIKLAMTRIARALAHDRHKARLVNMIHDELVLEVADAEAEAVTAIVRREMISAGAAFVRKVPVEIDIHVSEVWQK